MKALAKCIYCGRFFNPLNGQGDHILSSRLFGEFKGDKRFRGQCTACNNAFGCHEQVLAQSSQLGFYRQCAKPNLGKRKNRGGLGQKGAHGSAGPKMMMLGEGSTILVRPGADNPLDAHPFDQLVVRDGSGEVHHVKLFLRMRPAQLKVELGRRGLLSAMPIAITCPWDSRSDFHRLVIATYPNARVVNEIRTEPGSYPFRGRAEFVVRLGYWQALAKIAFHYYLVHNRRGFVGSEDAFSPIRTFIRHRGDPREFFRPPDIPFIVPFGREGPGTVRCPANWCHLLAATDIGTTIFVYLQFFLGPGNVPAPIYVALAHSDAMLRNGGVWAHLYQQDRGSLGRFTGSVFPVPVSPPP